ncbi:MAG: serine hydrolase [Alphaproteobacteria bacterium]|nr:serine hydrolase [Alphaproteobacteria bacterium]
MPRRFSLILSLSKDAPRLLLVAAAMALLPPAGSVAANTGETWPGKTWTRLAAPESAGWSAAGLAKAQQYARAIGSTEVMIVHRGALVDAWGDIAAKSEAYSVRKSVLSALIGIAVAKKQIDITQTMAALGIDDNPPLTAAEKQATVADLLKARSGVYHPSHYETERMVRDRPARGSHPPGSFWYYNNWDFNALATIYETRTGEKVFEAVARNLAGPLEMEDFRPADGRYVGGGASLHPAYPMRLSTRDLARFGLLYLRNGRWKDRQVVPAAWVAESTAAHSDAGGGRGYGYMWWSRSGAACFAAAKPEVRCFNAAGNYGQYVLVIPALDLVVVHRVNTDASRKRVGGAAFRKLVALIVAAMP